VLPVAIFHRGTAEGCAALLRVIGSGILAAALDALDAETLDCGPRVLPRRRTGRRRVRAAREADGSREEAERIQAELVEAAGEGALGVYAPRDREGVDALWRWRSGLAFSVLARRGGVVAEDIVVPLDRVEEAMDATVEIGRRHGLVGLSFGHAGDGNLHSAFLVDPNDHDELARVEVAVEELFELAIQLGGSVSGEHGLGLLKRGRPGAAVVAARARPARADQARLRPEEPAQPGEEARPPAPRRTEDDRHAELSK
jgi:FAD/FMN-containing dehydrogenase